VVEPIGSKVLAGGQCPPYGISCGIERVIVFNAKVRRGWRRGSQRVVDGLSREVDALCSCC